MPCNNSFILYWDAQLGLFTTNLAAIRQRPSKKAIHDIRVAIKKIKSCLLLANYISDNNPHLKCEHIQLFFKISGKLRDEEMSLNFLRKITREEGVNMPTFQKKLFAMVKAAKENTSKSANAPLSNEAEKLNKEIRNILAQTDENMLSQKTEELAGKTLQRLRELIENFSGHAHAIRKQLKQLFYWLGQCPVNPFFDEKQMKVLDRALSALGNWHDYFVFKDKLKKFRKEYLVKKTDEYNDACKLGEIIRLLQQQWLVNAEQKVTRLLKTI